MRLLGREPNLLHAPPSQLLPYCFLLSRGPQKNAYCSSDYRLTTYTVSETLSSPPSAPSARREVRRLSGRASVTFNACIALRFPCPWRQFSLQSSAHRCYIFSWFRSYLKEEDGDDVCCAAGPVVVTLVGPIAPVLCIVLANPNAHPHEGVE